MLKIRHSRRFDARIPTASMADIAFLLIIFFMVTTVHDVDRTSVALPLSKKRVDTEKGAAYVVVYKDSESGEILYKFSDGKQMSHLVGSPDDLFLEASQITHRQPKKQFVVKGDATVRYAVIDEVLDNLRKAGVENVLLLTQQKAREAGG